MFPAFAILKPKIQKGVISRGDKAGGTEEERGEAERVSRKGGRVFALEYLLEYHFRYRGRGEEHYYEQGDIPHELISIRATEKLGSAYAKHSRKVGKSAALKRVSRKYHPADKGYYDRIEVCKNPRHPIENFKEKRLFKRENEKII